MATTTTNNEPPRKRARNEEETSVIAKHDDDDDDQRELEALLMDGDDDFVTEATRQEQHARQRRDLRKQRLAILQQQQDDEMMPVKRTAPDESKRPMASMQVALLAPAASTRTTNGPTISASKAMEVDKQGPIDDKDDDDDEFDMFSSSVSPVAKPNAPTTLSDMDSRFRQRDEHDHHHEQADYDDAEGYYKAVIGEIISVEPPSSGSSTATFISFRVAGVIGKGVFSTVLKCSTMSNSSSVELPPVVAVKCIRHNDTMTKAALKELAVLLRLKGAPGIVPLLLPTTTAPMDYRGHSLLVFSFMEYNLRDVLVKFGKGVGLSLQAVRSYCGQLLAALTQLKKHGILHADLKPDNILVSSDFGLCQIADFGSAVEANSADNMATPYLVSRYYRAPEVILGLQPTFAMDLWSTAVTVVELFLGDVLFRGQTNNDMLFTMMQHLGPMSNRFIRQHFVQAQRVPNVVRQFQQDGPSYNFVQQAVDPVTRAHVIKVRPLSSGSSNNSNAAADKFPNATPLSTKIVKARSANDKKSLVAQFADLMTKCLALDPSRRIELRDALRHDFFAAPTVKPVAAADVTHAANGHGYE